METLITKAYKIKITIMVINSKTESIINDFKNVIDVSKKYTHTEMKKILSTVYKNNTMSVVDEIDDIVEVFNLCTLKETTSRGGMSETTLNSSITELFPCIAFEKRYFPENIEDLHKFILSIDVKTLNCVNSQDITKTQETIKKAHSSTKFNEKMENAIAILKYLKNADIVKQITEVRWGYRSKPFGASSKHTGDIFIKYYDGKIIGLSLKTGGKKTSEPQLNTYVNPVFSAFGEKEMLDTIRSTVYEQVYSKIVDMPPIDTFDGGDNRHNDRKKTENALYNYHKLNNNLYEKDYNTMLEIVRTGVVELFNKNKDATLNYIRSEILRYDPDIPTVVIKVIGNITKEVTDTHELDTIIPFVKSVSSYVSKTSKQDWFIRLQSDDKTVVMKMSIRTNKPGNAGQKKLGQFPTKLAIKYNGLDKS